MARKRTLNRRDLREQAEAAEARAGDEDEVVEDEEASADEEAGDDEAGDDEEVAKPKKKAAPKKKATTTTKRTRAPKEVRMKAVWVVFDNGSKRVDTFPFNQKAEAEALLARKQEEKKGTFYIQLVKDPME